MNQETDQPTDRRSPGTERGPDGRERGWLLRYLSAQEGVQLTEVYPGRYWFRSITAAAPESADCPDLD